MENIQYDKQIILHLESTAVKKVLKTDELLLKIFNYLNNTGDLARAGMACKRWSCISKDKLLSPATNLFRCNSPIEFNMPESYHSIFSKNIKFARHIDFEIDIDICNKILTILPPFEEVFSKKLGKMMSMSNELRRTHQFIVDEKNERMAITHITGETIYIFNKKDPAIEIPDLKKGIDRHCLGLCFLGDFLIAHYVDLSGGVYFSRNYLKKFSLITQKEENAKGILEIKSHFNKIKTVADENSIVIVSPCGTIQGLDPSNFESKYTISIDENCRNGFDFVQIHEGKLFLKLPSEKFNIYDAYTGALLHTIDQLKSEKIEFSGKYMAVLNDDKTCIEIWNHEVGVKEKTFQASAEVIKLKFQLENKDRIPYLAAALRNGNLAIWSVADDNPSKEWTANERMDC